MSRKRTIAIGAGLAAAGAAIRRHRGTGRVPTDPFDPNAIRAETAATRAAELVARPRVRRADLALTFAPAIATAVDPLLHGRRYFPRILEDIAAATDHVHLLIGLKATHCLADVLRELKKASSVWVHEEIVLRTFAWQEGYAAFTVSATAREAVRSYIAKQEEHHRVRSFREEVVEMLEKAGITYDAKFLD
jgi:hypothetical protein